MAGYAGAEASGQTLDSSLGYDAVTGEDIFRNEVRSHIYTDRIEEIPDLVKDYSQQTKQPYDDHVRHRAEAAKEELTVARKRAFREGTTYTATAMTETQKELTGIIREHTPPNGHHGAGRGTMPSKPSAYKAVNSR